MEDKGCLLCSCCGWRKGMSRDKVTSSSEETKPVAPSIVELCLAEGISWSVCQLVENRKILNLITTCWKGSEDIFELGYA